MSKHTNSPWFVEVDPVCAGSDGVRYQAIWIWAADHKSIVLNKTFHPDLEKRHTEIADTRLIAAAPELLEACRAIVNTSKMWGKYPVVIQVTEEAFNACVAAIAKAEDQS